MAICDKCGGEIEFRYVDGVLRPLHIGGGLCDGLERVTEPVPRHGWTHDCYLDPNASCPVCGALREVEQGHAGEVAGRTVTCSARPPARCRHDPLRKRGKFAICFASAGSIACDLP